MKKTLLTGILLAAFAMPVFAESAEDIANKYPGYKLAFQDEFETGEVPDHDVWNFEYGFKRNEEDQLYRDNPANAFIRDGKLVICALDDTTANPFYDRHSSDARLKKKTCYTSASMQSVPRYHFGIWETCAKLPIGNGYWPAIWGTGNTKGWPSAGELDIMEYYGDAIHANLAWGDDWQHTKWNSRAPRMSEFDANFADVYHIWRCEWDHNSVRIYLDDRLLNETDLDMTVNSDGYNPYRDPNNGFQVWLNLAIGGINGGDPEKATYPAEYLVEYTRVYEPASADAALIYRIHKAEKLLEGTVEGDKPMQYPAAARKALGDAIETAKASLGATDDDTIDSALDALQGAMDKYESSMSVGINVGEPFSLIHSASGCYLSSGWHENQERLLVLNKDEEGYNQTFTLVNAPEDAAANGYNILTGDGKYVYRTAWNLYVTSDVSKLKNKDYIFNLEIADGKIIIKNQGSGQYFGSDDVVAWSHLYSDKAGKGNSKAYFELAETTGIGSVAAEDMEVSAVYNLQGMRVADSIDEVRGTNRAYIVVRGSKAFKAFL